MSQPTTELYSELQEAYSHFNRELFSGRLPECVITLQRESRSYGYFSRRRFARRSGHIVDEIALNPTYFGIRPIVETLATLVHEMVHCQQEHTGSPGRRGYHNKEWASLMDAVGLAPSSSGAPGGRRVGERVTHYVVSGGPFDLCCSRLLTRSFELSWWDRFPPAEKDLPVDEASAERPSPAGAGAGAPVSTMLSSAGSSRRSANVKSKYRCQNEQCRTQVWGRPGLAIRCGAPGCSGLGLLEAL